MRDWKKVAKVASLSEISDLQTPDGYFSVLLAVDANDMDTETIASAVRQLLTKGMVVLCVWGKDCERVHDIADEVIIGERFYVGTERVILTTWHNDESLEETAQFAKKIEPAEGYLAEFKGVVGISIGPAEQAKRINHVFRNLP